MIKPHRYANVASPVNPGERGKAPVAVFHERLSSPLPFDPELAACRGSVDVFEYAVESKRAQKVAKAVCRTCPVMWLCRRYSLEAREEWGVWGGLNSFEREQILARWENRKAQNVVKPRYRRSPVVRRGANQFTAKPETEASA